MEKSLKETEQTEKDNNLLSTWQKVEEWFRRTKPFSIVFVSALWITITFNLVMRFFPFSSFGLLGMELIVYFPISFISFFFSATPLTLVIIGFRRKKYFFITLGIILHLVLLYFVGLPIYGFPIFGLSLFSIVSFTVTIAPLVIVLKTHWGMEWNQETTTSQKEQSISPSNWTQRKTLFLWSMIVFSINLIFLDFLEMASSDAPSGYGGIIGSAFLTPILLLPLLLLKSYVLNTKSFVLFKVYLLGLPLILITLYVYAIQNTEYQGPGSNAAVRDAINNDLVNYGAKAQQYYRRPISMGGGGYDFKGFRLSAPDTSNYNGQYAVDDDSLGAVSRTVGSTDSIAVSTQEIWIVGIGVEIGNDGKSPVKAIIKVPPNTFGQPYVLN
jgi:hypothetical protein